MKTRPPAGWLLSREAAVAIAVLALALWGGAIWSYAVAGPTDRFGALKGTDFAQFYIAARFAAAGRLHALYDWPAFAADLAQAVPHSSTGALYLSVYPPQLALLFAPLARFDYLSALGLWSAVSAGLYAVSIAILLRETPGLSAQRRAIVLLAVAFPAFQQGLLHGQIGTLVLVAVAAAWWAWRRDAWWLAGFALGSLAFKPPMCTIPGCAVLLFPGWRLLLGVACGVLTQFGVVVAISGLGPIEGFRDAMIRVLSAPEQFEPKLWQMHSLRGAIELLAGHNRISTLVWGLGVIGVLWLASAVCRRTSDRRLQFAAIVLAGLLIDPHLYVYDLVVLAVPLCLLASWLNEQAGSPVALTALALFWAPLVGPFAGLTHVQLTSPLLVIVLWQISQVEAPTAAASTQSTWDR
jgi:hypothetical protein